MPRRIFCLAKNIIEEEWLPNVINAIGAGGCDYKILTFKVGSRLGEQSFLKIEVFCNVETDLNVTCGALIELGMYEEVKHEAIFKHATRDRFAPDDFYAADNSKTEVLMNGSWHTVTNPMRDAVVVKTDSGPVCKRLRNIKKNDLILCGGEAVRTLPSGIGKLPEFNADVMVNTSVAAIAVADILLDIKATGKKAVIISGSATLLAGGGEPLAALVRAGYVGGFLADNTFAAYDMEEFFFGTVMGVQKSSTVRPGKTHRVYDGGRNLSRSINRVNGYGSIMQAVEAGGVTSGVMYELHLKKIPFCLAGAIGDFGPVMDTITDITHAQEEFTRILTGAEVILVLADIINAIAVTRLAPAWIPIIYVNDRASAINRLVEIYQAETVGINGDVGVFLRALAYHLSGVKVK